MTQAEVGVAHRQVGDKKEGFDVGVVTIPDVNIVAWESGTQSGSFYVSRLLVGTCIDRILMATDLGSCCQIFAGADNADQLGSWNNLLRHSKHQLTTL